MLNRMWLLVGCLFLGLAWAGTSIWVLIQTPATDTFNGISAPNSDFAIAVGENGTIVHFIDGDNGTLMPSGTTEELYDVYASSPNLAVATGEDVVLLWDGVSWSTLFAGSNDTIFTGTWISPEEDVILYGYLGNQFSFVCPEIPANPDPLFCRTFGPPMLTACGNSGDIKLFTTAGDVYWVNNLLGDVNGSDPVHDESLALSLDGIWVPSDSCLIGPTAPLEAFAIRNHVIGELWHFYGDQWVNMNVNVPAGQTFTWIGGTSSNHVIAVGFKPDGLGGNEGVVWNYDGNTWTEDTNLPPGTPGLTDIAVNVSAPDFIFLNGFDTSGNRMADGESSGLNILLAAEVGFVLDTPSLFVSTYSDLVLEKSRLSTGPFRNGDSITYQLVIQNIGTEAAIDFRFVDYFNPALDYVSDTCGLTFFKEQNGWKFYDTRVTNLLPNEVRICTMSLTINGQVGDEIKNYAYLTETDDYNIKNNSSKSLGVFIEAP